MMGMEGARRMYQAVATRMALSLRSFGLSLTSVFMYVSLQQVHHQFTSSSCPLALCKRALMVHEGSQDYIPGTKMS